MAAKILIILEDGGVASVFSTTPVEVIIQDYDVPPDSDFSDEDNEERQTIEFTAEEIEVVTEERLAEIIRS